MKAVVSLFCFLVITGFVQEFAWAEDPIEIALAEASTAREKATEANADLLSPIGFSKAEKKYATGQKSAGSSWGRKRALNQLREAEVLFQQATQNAKVTSLTLKDALESRDAASKAGSPERAQMLWSDGEKSLELAAKYLEQERRDRGIIEADKANTAYREAELVSIKAEHLTEARGLIEQADDQRVSKYATLTLTKARSLLEQAENALTQDRYQTAEPQRLANEASYEARHAMHIANSIQLIKNGTRDEEQLILYWEEPLERLARMLDIVPRLDSGHERVATELENKIMSLDTSLKSLSKDTKARDATIANLEEELRQMDELLLTLRPDSRSGAENRDDAVKIDELFFRDEAVVLQSGRSIIIRLIGLEFPSGSARLPENSTAVMKLPQALRLYPQSKLTIEGHTDSTGGSDDNRSLSQARAEALMNYLVGELKVPTSRVTAIGYGETRPIASNETTAGRAKNRRIDIVIIPR